MSKKSKMISEQNDLGKYIRTLRNNKGETLHQVSKKTDIDSPMLSKIERGQRLPTNEQLVKISKYFSVKIEDLKILFTAKKIIQVFGANETTYKALRIVENEIALKSNSANEKISNKK